MFAPRVVDNAMDGDTVCEISLKFEASEPTHHEIIAQ